MVRTRRSSREATCSVLTNYSSLVNNTYLGHGIAQPASHSTHSTASIRQWSSLSRSASLPTTHRTAPPGPATKPELQPRDDVGRRRQLLLLLSAAVGKVALVTGGASGIGEAIVRLFRQHGAKVCIADVQDETGQQLCDSLGGNPDVLFVHCDVTVEEDISRAVDATAEKFGTLAIMVNNAGITGDKVTDIRNLDFADVKKVFDINVHGMLLGMKHAARVMIPSKKGSIVSLASVASVIGGMGPHAYTASKHAVVGLTKSVALELGRHGIRVNCVSPYAVPTALSMPHLPQGEHKGDAVRDFLAFVGSEANLKGVDLLPKDVAEAVLYLASDEARYISALNLVVDGGFTSVNGNLKAFED